MAVPEPISYERRERLAVNLKQAQLDNFGMGIARVKGSRRQEGVLLSDTSCGTNPNFFLARNSKWTISRHEHNLRWERYACLLSETAATQTENLRTSMLNISTIL